LFGNPLSIIAKHTWPMDHPVLASWMICALLVGVAVPGALRRYRVRTND
jgi:ABC-2 type transport system permease protein